MVELRFTRLKNLLIFCLAASALFLAGQLWFDRIANRSLTYAVSALLPFGGTIVPAQTGHVLRPFRVVFNQGEGVFIILHGPTGYAAPVALLEEALLHGEFVRADALDWAFILENSVALVDYAFPVPTDFFLGVFNQTQRVINLSSRMQTFNAIAILPVASDTASHVIFIDEAGSRMVTYVVPAILAPDAVPLSSNSDITYISSVLADLPMFEGSHFVPVWQRGYYPLLNAVNPYAHEGSLMLDPIGRMVSFLFDNPERVYSARSNDGVFIYSNESTVVRYHPNGVLEYTNYSPPADRTVGTMATDFLTTLAFIGRGQNITMDYHLAAVRAIPDGHVFYFDYTTPVFPILWPETFVAEVGMPSPIIVTVEHNRVSRYQKFVYNFKAEALYAWRLDESFLEAYGARLGLGEAAVTLDALLLGYKMESSRSLDLSWFMGINGAFMVASTQ